MIGEEKEKYNRQAEHNAGQCEQMPRILIAAAKVGYQTKSIAEAARRAGIDVVLVTDRCHVLEDPWLDRAIAVRFEEPQEAAELVLQELGVIHLDGVIALADAPTTTAALVAARLGVPFHPASATEQCRNKGRAREAFSAAGMLVPRTVRYRLDGEAAAHHTAFPCVLKPTAMSASRGVIRADNQGEFTAAFARIRKILESPGSGGDEIQVEQYIPGREFAIEGLMTRGELRVLAIFDKPDPLEGPFFEETIYVTPSREPAGVQAAIVEAVRQAARALGLWHGPVHAEARVNEQGVWMLEVAARPIGGLCARVLRFLSEDGAAEITLEDLLVRHAVSRMPDPLMPARAASGVMMIPIPQPGIYRGVAGLEAARETAGIEDAIIAAVAGQRLEPPPEGGSYLGFLFAGGPDAAFVEAALRGAHGKLDFDIARTLDIITR